jgi:hypothetical protein
MGIDSDLLNRNNSAAQSSAAKVEALNEARHSGREGNIAADETDEPQTFLEARGLARKQSEKEQGAASAMATAITAPARQVTDKLLQQAWIHFLLFDSFGLTLIWINIHVFLRFIIGEKVFCKLGQEWTSLIPGADSNPLISKLLEKAGNRTGTYEVIGLAFFDALALIIIIGIGAIIYFVATANPIFSVVAALWEKLWGALTGST